MINKYQPNQTMDLSSKTRIVDLPDEILTYIFQFASSDTVNIVNYTKVCSKWRFLFQNSAPEHESIFKNIRVLFPSRFSTINLTQIKQIKKKKPKVNSLHDYFTLLKRITEQRCKQDYIQRVEKWHRTCENFAFHFSFQNYGIVLRLFGTFVSFYVAMFLNENQRTYQSGLWWFPVLSIFIFLLDEIVKIPIHILSIVSNYLHGQYWFSGVRFSPDIRPLVMAPILLNILHSIGMENYVTFLFSFRFIIVLVYSFLLWFLSTVAVREHEEDPWKSMKSGFFITIVTLIAISRFKHDPIVLIIIWILIGVTIIYLFDTMLSIWNRWNNEPPISVIEKLFGNLEVRSELLDWMALTSLYCLAMNWFHVVWIYSSIETMLAFKEILG